MTAVIEDVGLVNESDEVLCYLSAYLLMECVVCRPSALGHKPTSITRLQMVRYSPRSGHWASVCLLSGVKRTEINGPQNVRS